MWELSFYFCLRFRQQGGSCPKAQQNTLLHKIKHLKVKIKAKKKKDNNNNKIKNKNKNNNNTNEKKQYKKYQSLTALLSKKS